MSSPEKSSHQTNVGPDPAIVGISFYVDQPDVLDLMYGPEGSIPGRAALPLGRKRGCRSIQSC